MNKVREIEVATDLYSKEAVMNTIYKYTGKYYLKADRLSDTRILVIFESKDNNEVTDETINQFFNDLADQQIRINVGEEFKYIRETIVKKAFASINK